MLRSDMSSLHSKPMAIRSGLLRSPPHPKTSHTLHVTPQGARPAPAWAYLISEVHLKKLARIFKNHGVGAYHKLFNTLCAILVLLKTTLLITKKRRLWNPVTRMSCSVCQWNCPHTGDKDDRPPKTKISTNSCGRPWTFHQNEGCQSDSPWEQYVATQDPWVHRNQDPPPGHQLRPGVWAPPPPPPHLWRTRRISLIRLRKWPWWSRKLANLQHIWLW